MNTNQQHECYGKMIPDFEHLNYNHKPADAKPSEYVTSLEITARKTPLNFASNATPRRGGCCG